MARFGTLKALLLAGCLAVAAAQQAPLYQRPASFAEDCLPETTRATTFASIFPSDFFLTGDDVSTGEQSTTVTIAENFAVQYFPNYKVVTNTLTNETYVLYQCGSVRPSGSVIQGAKVFQIPLTSVAVPDTVPYAFLEILNVTDRVQGVSSFAVSACAQQALECNRTAVSTSNLSNETALAAEVLPFVDGITATTALDPAPPADAPIFTFSAAQDPGPLNRAEWVKFLGLFFNKEKEASDYFEGVTAQYNSLKNLSSMSNDVAPTIAWITHFVFDPSEYYQIAFTPYKLILTEDAGAKMIDRDTIAATPNVQVDSFSNDTYNFAWGGNGTFATKAAAQRAFLDAIKDVDAVIDETYAVDPTAFTFANFTREYGISASNRRSLKFLSGSGAPRVFREDGLISAVGGLDWFEGAIAHPEGVLSDLVSAFHSSGADAGGRNFTWFRNINQDPVVITSADCKAAGSCTVEPVPICPLVKACPDGTVVDLLSTSGCEYASCDGSTAGSAAPGDAPTGDQAAYLKAAALLSPLAAAAVGAVALLQL